MPNPDSSMAELVRDAVRDAQDLIRGEIALAKSEMREEVHRIRMGAAFLAGAALTAAIGIVFLMTTLAWAMSDVFQWPVWAGFGIVALVMLLTAGALLHVGRKRLTAQRYMRRTIDTVKENLQWMRARTS